MRKGKIIRFINTISSDGIAYFLLHLFQLMGQDFHVAADLLVGYPGIYLGGFDNTFAGTTIIAIFAPT
jgi:hypothetical protein